MYYLFQKQVCAFNFVPRPIFIERQFPEDWRSSTPSRTREIGLIYRGSVPHILKGQAKELSFVILRASLYRVSLNRGSTFLRKGKMSFINYLPTAGQTSASKAHVFSLFSPALLTFTILKIILQSLSDGCYKQITS